MPEQVNIASLSIDVDDVIKESVRLQKEMDKLKKSQKNLDKTTDEGAAAFAKSEAQLKNLSKAYRDNQQFASALDKTNEDLVKTMKVEGKSTQELYDSRRQLNVIAKNIKGNTEEEIALREQLNVAIDNQTEALREQQSEFNSGKDQIGEYTKGINASDLSLQNIISSSKEAGGATNLVAGGLKAATKGMFSLIKASVAFIATPIGIVLAAIAGAFLLIKNAMNRSEESTTKVKKAFSAFTGIVKGLLKFLQPLGDFLIDGLVKGFELVEKGVFKALGAIQRGLKFLGLDDAAASLGNFTEGIEEAVEASKELTEAELALAKAQRISRKVQLDYQKQAEKLRQVRDDETKAIEERIAANDKLGQVLKKQGIEEEAIAQKAIDLANLRIQLEGETKETLDEQAAALTELADIQERITGQVSEQLVNRVSLQKEAADQIREINEAQAELDEAAAKKQAEADMKAAEAAVEALKFELARKQELKDAEELRAAIDAENELQIIEENGRKQYEALVARLELEKEAEIKAAQETGASIDLINEKYAQRKKHLDNSTASAAIDGFGQVLDSYASILGEQTRLGKAAAIASTLITTAQSAVNAFNSLANIPYVGVGLGIAAAAAAVIAGAQQVSNIRNTPTTFSKGDILKGKSHSSGGIPFAIGGKLGFEAEGGEALINKKSTSMFAPLLSAINVAGGGRKFADGGIAGITSTSSASSIIDYDLLASRIAQANESLPAPIVSVEEINDVATNVSVIESLATD